MPIHATDSVQNAVAPCSKTAPKKSIQKSVVVETEGPSAAERPKLSASSLARANAKMHAAIKKNDLSALKIALAEGADPTDRAGTKRSALNAAAQEASPDCLEELARALASNSEPEKAASACTAALESATMKSPAHVKALMAIPNAWASQSQEKMLALTGKMKEPQFLAQDGGLNLLIEAIGVGKLKIKKENWQHFARMAIASGNEKALSVIHEKWQLKSLEGATKKEPSALFVHLATHSGSVACLRILLASGCDVNQKNTMDNTALWMMSTRDTRAGEHPEFFRELLAHADLNARGLSNATPLHAAARAGSQDRVSDLLKAGANANAQDVKGQTPLMAAIIADEKEVVAILAAVSNASVKQKNGHTAMDIAIDTELWDCVEILAQKAGPDNAMQIALTIAKKFAPKVVEMAEAAAERQELRALMSDTEKTLAMKKDGAQETLPQRKTPRL